MTTHIGPGREPTVHSHVKTEREGGEGGNKRKGGRRSSSHGIRSDMGAPSLATNPASLLPRRLGCVGHFGSWYGPHNPAVYLLGKYGV